MTMPWSAVDAAAARLEQGVSMTTTTATTPAKQAVGTKALLDKVAGQLSAQKSS